MARSIPAGQASFTLDIKDKLTGKIGRMKAKLKGALGRVSSFATSTVLGIGTAVAGIVVAVGAAAAAVATTVLAAAKSFAKFGDDVAKMSRRTGVAASSLIELGFAAEQSGTDSATLERGLFGLSRSIFDLSKGTGEAVDAYGRLGISFSDLDGLSPEEQFLAVAKALSKLKDQTIKGAIAQKLFGRSGRQLVPLLDEGADGIERLRQEARDLGLVLSDADLANAEKLTDSYNRFGRVVKAVFLKIGASVGAPLSHALDDAAKFIAAVTQGFQHATKSSDGFLGSIKRIGKATEKGGLFAGIDEATKRIQSAFSAASLSIVLDFKSAINEILSTAESFATQFGLAFGVSFSKSLSEGHKQRLAEIKALKAAISLLNGGPLGSTGSRSDEFNREPHKSKIPDLTPRVVGGQSLSTTSAIVASRITRYAPRINSNAQEATLKRVADATQEMAGKELVLGQ